MVVRSSRLIVAWFTLVAVSACIAPRTPMATRTPMAMPDVIRVKTGGRIVSVPVEEYVRGSTLSEVSPVGESVETAERIFAVQAVLARTYALAHLGRHREEGFDLCDTTHCQLYEPSRIRTSRFTEMARRAVDDTRQTVLVFQGQPADAVYHADCGGHTASADAVWGGAPVDYLSGATDAVPSATHRTWEYAVSSARLHAALEADPRTHTGGTLGRVSIATRDTSGRAQAIEVRGRTTVTVRADTFRAILARAFGERSILSTRFTVTHRGQQFQFTGSGFGHGVGLCQVGAAARARRGISPDMIFAAYFPGTSLTKLRPGPLTVDLSQGRFPGLIKSP